MKNRRDFRVTELDVAGIARGIYEWVVAARKSKPTNAFVRKALVAALKDWNQYVDKISARAMQKIEEDGIKIDLKSLQYGEYRAKLRHRGFHWEHFVTATPLVDEILEMENPTAARIEAKLKTLVVCLILEVEDRCLPKSNRPDPIKAYADAKIELLPIQDVGRRET